MLIVILLAPTGQKETKQLMKYENDQEKNH